MLDLAEACGSLIASKEEILPSSGCIVNYFNEKMIDLCPVSAEGLNYSWLGSLGMLYVFQVFWTSIFGYDLTSGGV